ncbi:MAG: hypothetical protein ABWZ65_08185 [Pseudomonas mandelii]
MKNTVFAFGALLLLCGCSSEKDEMHPFMECSIAAGVLNQSEAARTVIAKGWEFRAAHNMSFSPDEGIEMHNEIREEWLEHGKSKQEQISHLLTVFNSPQCVALHNSQKLALSDIDLSKIADPKIQK